MIGQATYNKPLLQNWCKASCRSCTTNLKGTYYSNPFNESKDNIGFIGENKLDILPAECYRKASFEGQHVL